MTCSTPRIHGLAALVSAALLFCSNIAAASPDALTLAAKACATDDVFVQHAILDYVKELHPNRSVDVDRFFARGCKPEESTPQQATTASTSAEEPQASPQEEPASLLNWSAHALAGGEIEAAADWQTGDTEERNLLARLELNHTAGRLRNRLQALAQSERQSSVTTAEEYRANLRSDYKLTTRWFGYGELEYTDDRFSGYDYRISELVGLGYILYDTEPFYWDVRSGLGARQDRLVSGERENSLLNKWESELRWSFAQGWTLSQQVAAAFSGGSDIYESETALKSAITDALALRASYYVEYIDDAPAGSEDVDTRTTLGVVYGF